MYLRKKFNIHSKIRYPLAVLFIVFPALTLGIAGSKAIKDLESLPQERYDAAKASVAEIRKSFIEEFHTLVPELVPRYDLTEEEIAAKKAQEEYDRKNRIIRKPVKIVGVEKVPESELILRQQRIIFDDTTGILDGVINFYGQEQRSSFFRNEERRSGLSDIETQLLLATARRIVSNNPSRKDLRHYECYDYGHGRVTLYLELGDPKNTIEGQWWSAWVLYEDAIAKELKSRIAALEPAQKLEMMLVSPTSMAASETNLRMVFDFDQDFLPGYSVAARVDKSKLAIGGEDWRSKFYIVFLWIAVPLLAGILWYIEVVVRRELEDAKNKVDFVANVSHELKTPLTSIRMFIEMLLMGRSSSRKEVHESLEIILRESERLGRLIDRLLDFNRLDRKKKIFENESLSLAQILRETVKIYRAEEAASQERNIALAIDPELPRIDGDHDALREVILNLIANADKYSPRDKPINVVLTSDGRWVLLKVMDQGLGIPAKYHQRIFEKFYRVNDELSRQVDGTGLGLSISQNIAKGHGGIIEVESAPGQGSCFTLRIPAGERPLPDTLVSALSDSSAFFDHDESEDDSESTAADEDDKPKG